MSDRHTRYWFDVYRTALRHFGVETKELKKPTMKSVERLRKEWNKQKDKHDEQLNVREIYRQQIELEKQQADFREQERDENYRTITADNMHDEAWDIIYGFIDTINRLYQDAIENISGAENQETGIEKQYHIIAGNKPLIRSFVGYYEGLVTLIGSMLDDVGNNPEPVAEAIKRNGELDYVEAISLVPPSGVMINFRNTVINMNAIWKSVIAEAREIQANNSGI